MERVIFHIDVNSAYLSWEAAYRLQHGETQDLRDIPSIVGGDEKSRHGIVLARSIPAKKYGILTGEALVTARKKCATLNIVPPRYELYMACSGAMIDMLREYSPKIQIFSIDECFMDYTGMEEMYGPPVEAANAIRERIKKELGFTVNIGISTNKLLAKMGGELKKPDKVCTLFPWEIKDKMWPLPIEELYMVGRRTAPKLRRIGITTVGQLANADVGLVKAMLKSPGVVLWNFANGIEMSDVNENAITEMKGIGNSTTISFDVDDRATALKILLSLSESVAARLRQARRCAEVVSVSIRNFDLVSYSHQMKLCTAIDSTIQIYYVASRLFDQMWRGQPIRHMGIRLSGLKENDCVQLSFFDGDNEKKRALDSAIDGIRKKYGSRSVVRSCFVNSGLKPVTGGVIEDDYQLMTSIL